MLILTESFTQGHKERIASVNVDAVDEYFKSLLEGNIYSEVEKMKILGVLYSPIVLNEWDFKAIAFCGGELDEVDVKKLAFFFIEFHFDQREMYEHRDTMKTEELNYIHFE